MAARVALLVAAALSGCVDPGVAPDAGVGLPAGAPRDWSQEATFALPAGSPIRVALDGDTAVVAAVRWAPESHGTGFAKVFTRSGSTWVREGELVPSDGRECDFFGGAVAISGRVAVVGAAGYCEDLPGAAYVFRRELGVWSEVAKLQASAGGPGDRFGRFVAISGDTIVVAGSGTTYVFRLTAWGWRESAVLPPAPSVSASLAGELIVAGGSESARVMVRASDGWQEEAELRPSAPEDGRFGAAVAVDGPVAVIGAPGRWLDDPEGPLHSGRGAAYVFVEEAGVWRAEARLPGGGADDGFGCSTAVGGDIVVVGGCARFGGPAAAAIYRRGDVGWLAEGVWVYPAGDPYAATDLAVAVGGDRIVVARPVVSAGGVAGIEVIVYARPPR